MKDRRRRSFWEDFDEDQQRFMLRRAMEADSAQQARLDDLRQQVLDPNSTNTTFHTYQFRKPEAWDAMNKHEQRAYMKQARRDWKRSTVTKTVTHKIGGGVDVSLSRRRNLFEGGRIEQGLKGNPRTTVASFQPNGKGELVKTFDFFKNNPDPADAAKVFGIPFESAFDNLPPRRPKQGMNGGKIEQGLSAGRPKQGLAGNPQPKDPEDKDEDEEEDK